LGDILAAPLRFTHSRLFLRSDFPGPTIVSDIVPVLPMEMTTALHVPEQALIIIWKPNGPGRSIKDAPMTQTLGVGEQQIN
jgi:hypothetical protein